ncbi:MAG: TolC family protein [Bacteroidetes bacterium]|nr:TolC family protein [Bacteroidota bacterium]
MRRLILLLIIPFQSVFGQTKIPLDSCYAWAQENYPNLKQSEVWANINSLNQENIKTNYLPKVTLNGQATYQSDVTGLEIPIPNLSVPKVSKDQYKVYAELRQNIWDGGISDANARLEDAILKSNLSELEVELYRLNQQVAQSFFTVLMVKKQLNVLVEQEKVLFEKLKLVESGVKNGILEKSAGLVLQAEILNIDQNKIQLNAGENASLQMLSILTGKTDIINDELVYTESQSGFAQILNRPEIQFFNSQSEQLETNKYLLDKTRNPKLFGFGQAGYGKPALNMLSNSFDAYYLVGLGVSWNAFDWKNTSRKKQVIQHQQEMIQFQKETFTQNIQMLLVQQKEQILKIGKMLENDQKMVSLRTEITKSAASKLENETITASDYIQEMQNETVAKLNYELHKIQLSNAQEKYIIINGREKLKKPSK